MSILIVDGKEFVPATHAGKHFGYTKDYLLLLIKGAKIEGKKIGNKWYVYLPSAERYFKDAEKNRDVQRKAISALRKEELKHHAQSRTKTHHHKALVETLAIVVIGLSLGATGYFGSTTQVTAIHESGQAYHFLERLAISLYTFVSPGEVGYESVGKIQVQDSDTSVSAVIQGTFPTTSEESLIVAPVDVLTPDSITSIQESFSDYVEVVIDPENPETGIITPVFRDSESESYRFLMVPVTPIP